MKKRLILMVLALGTALLCMAAAAADGQGSGQETVSFDMGNGWTVTVPGGQKIETGIDLIFSGAPGKYTFALELRMPPVQAMEDAGYSAAEHEYGNVIYISSSNENEAEYLSVYSNRHGVNVDYSEEMKIKKLGGYAHVYPKVTGSTIRREGNGDLVIHIDFEEMNDQLANEESWPYDIAVIRTDSSDPSDTGTVIGRFTIRNFPEGFTKISQKEMLGAWKFISSSDGGTTGDIFIKENEYITRRTDPGGEYYYAPRRIERVDGIFIREAFERRSVFKKDNLLLIRNADGTEWLYERTDEKEADYKRKVMGDATPLFVRLFNVSWCSYDPDFGTDTSDWRRFYENEFYQHGYSKNKSLPVRYEGEFFFIGDKKYIWYARTIEGYLYMAEVREDREPAYIKYRGMGEWTLLQSEVPTTPTPIPGVTPVPVPGWQWTRKDLNNCSSGLRLSSDTKNRLSEGFKMAREIDEVAQGGNKAQYNTLLRLNFSQTNGLCFVQNRTEQPVRYRLLMIVESSRPKKIVRFFSNSHDKVFTTLLQNDSDATNVIYTQKVLPGQKLFFNVYEDGEKSSYVFAVVNYETFDDSMPDAFSHDLVLESGETVPIVTPRPADVFTPTPKPTGNPVLEKDPETPVPETPVPATPVPDTPAPVTPVPVTPAPVTPAPDTPVPVTPAPYIPDTPAPESAAGNSAGGPVVLSGQTEGIGLELTLSADGSAVIILNYPEGEEEQNGSWFYADGVAYVKGDGRYGARLEIRFENGCAVTDLEGKTVSMDLPNDRSVLAALLGENPERDKDSNEQQDAAGLTLSPYIPDQTAPDHATPDPYPVLTLAPTPVPTPAPTPMPTPELTPVPKAEPVSDPAWLEEPEAFTFKSGQKLAVYSAPDKKSWRADKKKAALNTKDGEAHVFGKAGGWLMIMYTDSHGTERVGYIEIKAIKGNKPSAGGLQFARTKAMISGGCDLTDDPKTMSDKITRLEAGTEVTYLATYGQLAYIEAAAGKQKARGFVKRDCIVIISGKEISPRGISASEWIRQSKVANAYHPKKMLDGKKNTSWQVSANKTQLSSVYIDVELKKPTKLTTMDILNGFWSMNGRHDQYERNARLKKIEISFCYEGRSGFEDAMTVTLPETKDWKNREIGCLVDLNGHYPVTAIRIRPLSYYHGSAYPHDICVSEIRLYGEKK